MSVKNEIAEQTVIKSREMVAAIWDDMTLKEAQLMLLAISMIPRSGELNMAEPISIEISKKMMDESFGLNNMTSSALSDLSDLIQTRRAIIKPVEMLANDGNQPDLFNVQEEHVKEQSWSRMVIVPTCKYSKGVFSITFNRDLNPHFLVIHDQVTRYKLRHVLKLKSPYYILLYGMLLSGEDKESYFVTASVSRIKEMIGAKGKYPLFADFRRSVLEPGVDAINESTDIRVEYEILKRGRSVSSIQFKVRRVPCANSPISLADLVANEFAVENDPVILLDRLLAAGVSRTKATTLVASFLESRQGVPFDEVLAEMDGCLRAAKEFILRLRSEGKKVFLQSIFEKAITEGWEPAEVIDPRQAFLPLPDPAPPELKVDYVKVIEAIESEPKLMDGFVFFINNPLNRVAVAMFEKDGIRSLGLKQEVLVYGAKLKLGSS